jgi:SAM-dependent methyltransferase
VVELGCGSGITARRLTDAGHDVLGIDQSAPLIALARERAPGARFTVGSFVTEPLPECDAVLAIGEVLNYLFDEGNTRAALPRCSRASTPRCGRAVCSSSTSPDRASRPATAGATSAPVPTGPCSSSTARATTC